MRTHQRQFNQLRKLNLTRHYTRHAEGSILVELGETRVICTASITPTVPPFMKDTGRGWITAEYGMLPRSTHERMQREAAKGKQVGRTLEIQRLISRSLRATCDLSQLGERTIMIDCDVIQADAGTRTAAITGGCLALYDAIQFLLKEKKLIASPFQQFVAAISCGIYQNEVLVDLDYQEDSQAETDMNVVMNEFGGLIEVQGTAEKHAFSQDQLNDMLKYATESIKLLIIEQKKCVGLL